MPKKIKFESFKYHFLATAQDEAYRPTDANQAQWREFLKHIEFSYKRLEVSISWQLPGYGSITERIDKIRFYVRGDSEKDAKKQRDDGLLNAEDPIKLNNNLYFKEIVMRVASSAGYRKENTNQPKVDKRILNEREFHDVWADSEDVTKIDVRTSNEACTAPEMRYIIRRLGKIKNRRLLDVGCGLGEASVYFALLGADVTSSDLSQGMLDATARLAQANGVSVKQHVASAEDMQLPTDAKFDIIYAGNLLHHVDIEKMISRVKPHLAEGGLFVTWDPLAYNPAINVYRSMATDVRTPDEHPLTMSDIKTFHKHFCKVETRYFWLTTLLIFIIMALVQRRNPNKERFWKVIIHEGEKWRWIYTPLEFMDKLILWAIPPLRLLCWNTVIVATNPKKIPTEDHRE